MMKLRATWVLIILLLIASASSARRSPAGYQFGARPYQQWTVRDVEKLLGQSGWAQTQAGLVSIGRTEALVEPLDTTITLRLRSALPIRQALARLDQLKSRYDQRSDSDRAIIDARNREILECPDCADYYIVSLTVGAGSRRELPAFLTSGHSSFEAIKQNVSLENEKHEARELKKFVAPTHAAGEAIFYFSRRDQKGSPLIGPNSRTVIVSFDPRVFDWKKATATKFKFNVADMIINGTVAF